MSKNKDLYYTIKKQERAEIKVKGSKFIATASPVPSKEKAKEILGTIRTEFHDATHNCFAYRVGPQGMEFRASDDGEPSGSAGNPILFAIKKHNLSDLIVIVTRYFGGKKLGVGGLARAYKKSAERTLKFCKKKPVYIIKKIRVMCDYEDLSPVKRIIDKTAIKFEESYRDAVEIIAEIPLSKTEEFQKMITEQTSGRAGTVLL